MSSEAVNTAEYHAELARTIPERGKFGLQQMVMDLLKATNYRAYHTFDSRKSAPGFPDIIAIRGSRILAIELKREGKSPTAHQAEWLEAFSGAGVETYLWRPSDLLDGTIQRILMNDEQEPR